MNTNERPNERTNETPQKLPPEAGSNGFKTKFKRLFERHGAFLSWGFLLLSLIGIAYLTLHPYLALQNSDGAVFLILADSLYQGKGYLLSSLPNPEPYFPFTPLFTFQLAGLMTLFQPESLQAFVITAKSYVWLLWLLVLGCFYQQLKTQLKWHHAFCLTAILAINGTAHQYLPDILADTAYLLTSLLCLTWFLKAPVSKLPHWMAYVILGMTILTRPIGLTLGLADMVFSGFHKNWKRLILTGLVCALSYGSWISLEHVYRDSHPSHNPAMQEALNKSGLKLEVIKYFSTQNTGNDESGEAVQEQKKEKPWILSCLHRLEQYSRMVSQEIVKGEGQPGFVKVLLMLTSLGLILYGGFLVFQKASPLIVLYPVVYLGLLCTYPYVSGRYILPIAPFILLFAFVGADGVMSIQKKLDEKQKNLALLFMALLVFHQQFDEAARHWIEEARIAGQYHQAESLNDAGRGPATTDTQANLFTFYQWAKVRREMPEFKQSVIFTRKPEILYFYTGLKGERFPFFQTPLALHQWITAMCKNYQSQKQAYTCYLLDDGIYKESRKLLLPYAEAYQKHQTPVFKAQDSQVKLWPISTSP
jgi:hypothetical protein